MGILAAFWGTFWGSSKVDLRVPPPPLHLILEPLILEPLMLEPVLIEEISVALGSTPI